MTITRNNIEYELTQEELQQAYEERREDIIRDAVEYYFHNDCEIEVIPDGAVDEVTESVLCSVEMDDKLYLDCIPWRVDDYLFDNNLLEE